MKYILHNAKWILAVEVVVAVVLLVGLLVPLPGKVELKIVQSGSMVPALPVGSVVAIVPSASYAVGDMITFGNDTRKRAPTTHRIVDIKRENGSVRYITKGDANEIPDIRPITENRIIGKSIFTVPKIGWVQIIVRNVFSRIGV